jgi:two-component system, OmpR family, phosphate regulon response regulator PhoB
MAARILVIEDDAAIVTLVDYNLTASGYEVAAATTTEERAASRRAELRSGDPRLDASRRLRHRAVQPDSPHGQAAGPADSHADGAGRGGRPGARACHYVVKPFSVPELLARVAALLRRSAPERINDQLVHGDLKLDRMAHRVTRGSRALTLGPTEYKLLEVFLERAGRVLTRGQLIDRVWGTTSEIDERTIDVHIGRLRKSLIRGSEAYPIRTVRGTGYVLDLERGG